ncbi:MAG: MerR family transcriptional regulator [Deltaproteobacteria bacterium CG11_big_fil_rev_8_21_14_0_20_47_16]|nr:MAG: MerR family transcriptional regulator [Deltaproteobacteria bacterium CG11_big_fil_rev_8_21_14_0_20_47_16]
MERSFDIPNKLYFRIGEVSDIVGVKPYVLRYWETEFPDIRPSKSKSGQRLYKRRDVEMLLMVKELLYDKRFTIDGAKQRLRESPRDTHVIPGREASGGQPQQMLHRPPAQDDQAEDFIRSSRRQNEQLSIPMTSQTTVHVAPTTTETKKVLQKLRVDLEIMLRELQN